MKLIVGLGNPGEDSINNRSNIGFKSIDIIANNIGIEVKTKKKKALIGKGFFDNNEVTLVKPQTFSVLSGESVLYIASFLKIDTEDIIVIHEDWEVPFGSVVVGIAETHLKHPSVIAISKALHSASFIHIRVGIKNDKLELVDVNSFLNSKFEGLENLELIEVINEVESAVRSIFICDLYDVIDIYKVEED